MKVSTINRVDAKINRCTGCNAEIGNVYKINENDAYVSCVFCGVTETKKLEVINVRCTNCYEEEASVNLKDFECSKCNKVMDIELVQQVEVTHNDPERPYIANN